MRVLFLKIRLEHTKRTLDTLQPCNGIGVISIFIFGIIRFRVVLIIIVPARTFTRSTLSIAQMNVNILSLR